MIGTEFYRGQGLGNQLWVYAVVRSLAEEKGYTFGFLGTSLFKGHWLGVDLGISFPGSSSRFPRERVPDGFSSYLLEEKIVHSSGADISPLDRALLHLEDGTFLDGSFQTERYFSDPDSTKSWFQAHTPEQRDVCVINIRGGEFKGVTDLFLGKEYYSDAMRKIREIDSKISFEVVTDDPKLAKKWFPTLPIFSSGGVKRFHGGMYIHPRSERIAADFFRVQSAKYVILSNSSFSWWGAFSNPYLSYAIAPKFWARYNTGGPWSNGDSLTQGWTWLDNSGRSWTYQECLDELGGAGGSF